MEEENIRAIISETCKKYNIVYNDNNSDIFHMIQDAKKLGLIKWQMMEINGDLKELAEKYGIQGLETILEDDINKLASIAHDLNRLASRLLETRKKL